MTEAIKIQILRDIVTRRPDLRIELEKDQEFWYSILKHTLRLAEELEYNGIHYESLGALAILINECWELQSELDNVIPGLDDLTSAKRRARAMIFDVSDKK